MRKSLVLVLGACCLALSGCGDDGQPPQRYETPPAVASAIAEQQQYASRLEAVGFKQLDRGGLVFFKYLHAGDANYSDCGYSSGKCSVVEVAAPAGCDSLYVEANFVTDSGVVVDYSNDVAKNLRAGDHAVLHFVTFKDNVDKIQLTEASCR